MFRPYWTRRLSWIGALCPPKAEVVSSNPTPRSRTGFPEAAFLRPRRSSLHDPRKLGCRPAPVPTAGFRHPEPNRYIGCRPSRTRGRISISLRRLSMPRLGQRFTQATASSMSAEPPRARSRRPVRGSRGKARLVTVRPGPSNAIRFALREEGLRPSPACSGPCCSLDQLFIKLRLAYRLEHRARISGVGEKRTYQPLVAFTSTTPSLIA